MQEFVSLALQLTATIYGIGEPMCGDYHEAPKQCVQGLTTASGEEFRPDDEATAAIPLPRNRIMRPFTIRIRLADYEDAECVEVRVNDKVNARFIGERGFDLSKKAVEMLGGKVTHYWSGRVEQC